MRGRKMFAFRTERAFRRRNIFKIPTPVQLSQLSPSTLRWPGQLRTLTYNISRAKMFLLSLRALEWRSSHWISGSRVTSILPLIVSSLLLFWSRGNHDSHVFFLTSVHFMEQELGCWNFNDWLMMMMQWRQLRWLSADTFMLQKLFLFFFFFY